MTSDNLLPLKLHGLPATQHPRCNCTTPHARRGAVQACGSCIAVLGWTEQRMQASKTAPHAPQPKLAHMLMPEKDKPTLAHIFVTHRLSSSTLALSDWMMGCCGFTSSMRRPRMYSAARASPIVCMVTRCACVVEQAAVHVLSYLAYCRLICSASLRCTHSYLPLCTATRTPTWARMMRSMLATNRTWRRSTHSQPLNRSSGCPQPTSFHPTEANR